MKRLLILFMVVFVAFTANAQQLKTIVTDTVKGAETILFSAIPVTGKYQTLSIQFLCTQLGGTTDGTIEVQASNNNTNWFNLNNDLGKMVYASPYARMNDSIIGKLNLYNAATLNFVVPNPAHRYYRISVTGTAGDTTRLTGNYVLK
jgi:hypothetical protein